jgi:hypothetical protein
MSSWVQFPSNKKKKKKKPANNSKNQLTCPLPPKKHPEIQRAFSLLSLWRCQEDGMPREYMQVHVPRPTPCPLYLFPLTIPELYLFYIKLVESTLDSVNYVSHSNKLLKLKGRPQELPIFSWLVRAQMIT